MWRWKGWLFTSGEHKRSLLDIDGSNVENIKTTKFLCSPEGEHHQHEESHPLSWPHPTEGLLRASWAAASPWSGELGQLRRSLSTHLPPSWAFTPHTASAEQRASWVTPRNSHTHSSPSCHLRKGNGAFGPLHPDHETASSLEPPESRTPQGLIWPLYRHTKHTLDF